MARILLVFSKSKEELGEEIKLALIGALEVDGEKPAITTVGNEDEAKTHLRTIAYDLLITHLHIPRDVGAPLDESDERGLKLLKWVVDNNIKTSGILIVPSYTTRLNRFMRSPDKGTFLSEGEGLTQEVKGKAKLALDVKDSKLLKKCLDIEIRLLETSKWNYTLRGEGFSYREDGVLTITDTSILEELSNSSRIVGKIYDQDWEKLLRSVGRGLMRLLFNQNPEFYARTAEGLSKAGGCLEHTRVRFIVQKELYPIALEAVLYPQNDRYWMLQAPLYRRLSPPGRCSPLFCDEDEDRQPINCLIIDANVEGAVEGLCTSEGGPLDLECLKNVKQECANLERLLKDQKKDFNIGRIKLIRKEEGESSFSQRVRKLLEEEEWHLVHYGGHSYYDEKEGIGYVFFQDEFIEKVDIVEFSGWIRRTRFIYLSSCKSSAEDFVFELANSQVPAVIGFRWDLEDKTAAEYAYQFYKYLFAERSLEIAFLKARQYAFNQFRKDHIWASPMLILQV